MNQQGALRRRRAGRKSGKIGVNGSRFNKGVSAIEKKPLVLVAGIGRSKFDELAPVLDSQRLDVVQVTSAEDATKLAHSDRVDLVILDAEPTTMSLAQVVRLIRAKTSASRKASMLVLARPGCTTAARSLVDHGINKVMLAGDPPELIGRVVAELVHIAPRTTLRVPTRLLVEVADGADEALGAVVNISSSGLLVETDTVFEKGQHVVISIEAAGEADLLKVKAEVVRQADPERDGVEGIGVRFLEFRGDGRQRLDAILGDAFDRTPI